MSQQRAIVILSDRPNSLVPPQLRMEVGHHAHDCPPATDLPVYGDMTVVWPDRAAARHVRTSRSVAQFVKRATAAPESRRRPRAGSLLTPVSYRRRLTSFTLPQKASSPVFVRAVTSVAAVLVAEARVILMSNG
jgi:hypothetical protein